MHEQSKRHIAIAAEKDNDDDVAPLTHIDACRNLEAIAMFERVNNYGQTGNVKVISRRLMDPFYLSAIILKGALPFTHDAIRFVRKKGKFEAVINMQYWPQDPNTHAPFLSSLAGIKYHYNATEAKVSV